VQTLCFLHTASVALMAKFCVFVVLGCVISISTNAKRVVNDASNLETSAVVQNLTKFEAGVFPKSVINFLHVLKNHEKFIQLENPSHVVQGEPPKDAWEGAASIVETILDGVQSALGEGSWTAEWTAEDRGQLTLKLPSQVIGEIATKSRVPVAWVLDKTVTF